jgi:hypothetical protein
MLYGEDFDDIIEVTKANPVVAYAETEFRWLDIAEPFYIAFASDDRAGQSVKDAQGRPLFNGAEFGLCAILPNDFLGHTLLLRVWWL